MKNSKHTHPHAILVFGTPCSGRTTFCEQFAKQFRIPFFDLEDMEAQFGLTRELILLLVTQLARTGQNVIFKGALETKAERTEICNILRDAGYAPSIIWIQTDAPTTRLRLKQRYKSISKAKEIFDNAVASIEPPTNSEHPIIISGRHTFSTQLRHVLTKLA